MLKRSANLAKLLCILIVVLACSKKEVIYTKEQMIGMVPNEGPDKVEILLARTINDAIPCSNYGDGCQSVHRLRARNLEFIVVEFTNAALAEASAQRIRGWTVNNWLFDDIEGEPNLIRWLQKHFESAKRFKPLETTTDSAKKSAESAAPSPATAP